MSHPLETNISRTFLSLLAVLVLALLSTASELSAADRPETTDRDGWIAFQSRRDGAREIYRVSPDGSRLERLTRHRAHDGYPAWSPDGSQLVFNSERVGWWKVWTMSAEGGAIEQRTQSSSWDSYPKWSPDGSKIVFASGREGNSEIFVLDLEDGSERNLSRHPKNDNLPSWTPDGQIVFVSDRGADDASVIYRMDGEGGGVEPIGGDQPLGGLWPTVSADGEWLAMVSNSDGDEEIYLYRMATGDLRQLTHNETPDKWPTFSPDGRRLAYAAERQGNWDLYVLDLETGEERRLTTHTAMDMTPAWSPR